MPFGCLVNFLPRPDVVQTMTTFRGRSNQGILVGYRLQPGGRWARDYLVFPFSQFHDYDLNTPRSLHDFVPVITQEAKVTGGITFALGPCYDAS